MSDGRHFSKGSSMPPGIAVATVLTSEDQCCRDDCDSWRTVYVDVVQQEDEDADSEAALTRYAICIGHLGEFVDDVILRSGVSLIDLSDDDDNCGDPGCPVHGWMNQDEDDDDDDD